MILIPDDLRDNLITHWQYGQFADDFDQPLAKSIREDVRFLCEILYQHKLQNKE
jgi:hypothetical protein